MKFDIELMENITVAAPCPASWEEMPGSEQVRFCDGCKRNVYNLSAMTRKSAAALVQTHEGRLCVRYGRRSDGKLLTDNCPSRLRPIRTLMLRRWTALASFGLLLFNFSCKAVEAIQTCAPTRHAGTKLTKGKLMARKKHGEAGGAHNAAAPVSPRHGSLPPSGVSKSASVIKPDVKSDRPVTTESAGKAKPESPLGNEAGAGKRAPSPPVPNGSVFTTGTGVKF